MKQIKKPANLIYSVNETPNIYELILLGIQHAGLLVSVMVFVNMLANIIDLTVNETINLISICLFISGIATLLQAIKKGPVGSGFFAPEAPGASYFPVYLFAANHGGLSLIFGITLLGGFIQLIFSRIIKKLRILFPPEIAGLVVTMIGFSMITYSIKFFLGINNSNIIIEKSNIIVGLGTLSVIIILNIWVKSKLRLFSILIGIFVGYILAYFTGIINLSSFNELRNLPLFNVPQFWKINISFKYIFILPVIIAALASTLKCFGDIVSCQKINNADWHKTDLNTVSRGIFAEAISTMLSGLSGGLSLSTSSANIGLTAATGATSRAIAITHSLIFILLAFFPQFSGFIALIPKPVIGAVMLFAVCFMIITGLSIIMSRMLDVRKTFVIGFSMIFGLSVDLIPDLYSNISPLLSSIFYNSILAALIISLILTISVSLVTKFHTKCSEINN